YGRTPLHGAAINGQKEIVEYLVGKGADVNAKNQNGDTPLHEAASRGYKEIVEYLVGKGADVNAKNDYGRTPLHGAAINGQKEIVEYLVGKGADVNAKNQNGDTPLHEAANGEIKTYLFYEQYGLVEFLGFLLVIILFSLTVFYPKIIHFAITTKNGLLLRVYSPFKQTMLDENNQYLQLAVSSNNVDAAGYLLKLGCNPYAEDNEGNTILSKALENPEMTKCLLEYSTPDSEGQTWLHKVVAKGDFEQVKSLVSLGADINAQDKNGRSPLSLALEGEHSDIVKYLVKAGANTEIQNEKINPKYLVSVIKEKDNDIAFFLIDKLGADSTCSKNIPWPHHAVLNNNSEVLEYLLKLAYNPYTLNPDGKTVLELAMDNPLIADLILKFSKPDPSGETWIHKALRQQNIELVQFLIDKGVNIIARNKKGQRPVELAAELRLGKIGVLLVNAGGMGE
ncbi:MAG: ankyrin repeat domain-containing protein, partial [Brevinema sp.]